MTPEIKKRIEQIRRGEVPVGYKKEKDGTYPADWKAQKMKQWLSLKERPVSLEDEEIYKLVTVRRGFGGVDLRGQYKGKDILVKTYFEVLQGDLLISKRQIAHGACGVVPENLDHAVVSNEYNVFIPQGGTNVEMFNLMMQLPHYKRLFYLMSDGVHIEKLLFKTTDWMRRSLAMPPIEQQQKIAELLATQDKVIELKEKRIVEKQRQKKYLMQQLLTGKKRLKGYGMPWKTVELNNVFDYLQPTPYLVSSTDYSNEFETPVLTAGKSFILGYTNETQGIFSKLPVVIFDDFTTDSKYVNFPFKAKSSAMKILTIKKGFNIIFSYEAMQQIKHVIGGHERHWISKYSNLIIKAPCIEEQNEIAEVIMIASREIELLQNDLTFEKQKKKALMQLLLTGIVRVKT